MTPDTVTDPRLRAELPAVYEPLFLDEVDNIGAEAARRAAAGADEGLLLWARSQTAGRGQHADWAAPPGGLYSAVLLRPDFDREQWPEIGLVALLALGTAVAELLPPLTGLDYRWPNDLLLNGHKVGGIALRAQADALIVIAQLNVAPPVEGWDYASLIEDAAAETTPGAALTHYARHLLDSLQRWHDAGLSAITASLRARGLGGIADDGGISAEARDELTRFFLESMHD